MVHRVLRIGRWVVDFLFAKEDYDIDGVLSVMYDCGASDYAMQEAVDLMETGGPNCGFTFPNPIRMRAVVVIGPTTSGKEFQDTLVHEIHHLAVRADRVEVGDGVLDLVHDLPVAVGVDAAEGQADLLVGGQGIVGALAQAHQILRVLAEVGVEALDDTFVDKMIEMTDNMTPYSPSMKLDYDFHRQMEIHYIYSRPIEIACEAGYRMPKLEMLEAELRFLQAGYLPESK